MPVYIRLRLRALLILYFALAWGVSYAAIEAAPDLLSLPWAQAVVGVGVSWIGGFAASLNRLLSAAYANREFHHVKEFGRDGAVSAVIGLSGYWAGMANQIGPALLALSLLLAGYGGTRVLSVLVDKLIKSTE